MLKFSVIFTTCKQDFKFHLIPNKEKMLYRMSCWEEF